ncbi:lipopolysaccharide biosynthesis protein [Roseibacillus persicicus]|uniref:lipopolysaccharide biosynthesis protein n=1 Tax=Roseibacillus persicicus TaxID=454148 RepID=UPI00167C270E|nr:hypothetical protein [Roseibacillus persicicus]
MLKEIRGKIRSTTLQRVGKTFLAVLTGRALIAVRQIAVVPIFLSAWGVDYYGHWLILTAIPSFLSISNLGLGTSASNAIALSGSVNANSNDNGRLLSSCWIYTSIVATLVVTAIILIGDQFNSKGQIEHPEYLLSLLITAQFIKMLVQPLQGWWVAQGRPSKSINLINTLIFGELLLSCCIPLVGGHGFDLALFLLLWTLIWFVWVIVATKMKGCKIILTSRPRSRTIKSLGVIGAGHQLGPLWQAIYFQGTIIVAGSLFGATGAAIWGSVRVLARFGNQLVEVISQTIRPEFQRNYSKGSLYKNKALYIRGTWASLAVSMVFGVFLITFGPRIFNVWTMGKFDVSITMWILLASSLLFYARWWIAAEYLRSLNRPWGLNLIAILVSVLAILVAYFCNHLNLGIYSLAYSFLFFDVSMSMLVPKLASEKMCAGK